MEDNKQKGISIGLKLLLTVLFVFVYSCFAINVSAKELNKTGVIDNISIVGGTNKPSGSLDTNRTRSNDKFDIYVDFSAKSDSPIHSGDTLTFEFPENWIEGVIDEVDVTSADGTVLGIMVITNTQAVVTFNDNVDYHTTFSGALKIATTGNIDDQNATLILTSDDGTTGYFESIKQTDFGTDFGLIEYIVEEYYSNHTGGFNPNYTSKDGEVDTSIGSNVFSYGLQVKHYFLNVTEDIVLEDRLDDYQEYAIDMNDRNQGSYINVYREVLSEDGSEVIDVIETVYSFKGFEEAGFGTFVFNETNDSFTITIPKEKANGWTIAMRYRTVLNELGEDIQPEFVYNYADNYSKLQDPDYSIGYPEKLEAEVTTRFSSGNVQPDKNELWIMKKKQVNSEGWSSQEPLAGVVFNIYDEAGNLVELGENLVTDGDGLIKLPNLLPGKYYAVETDAPDGVLFDPTVKYPFEIKSEAQYGVILPITNKVLSIDLNLTKVSEDSTLPLEGAGFKLIKIVGSDEIVINEKVVSDSQGNVTFNGLSIGDYKIVESEAPNGYEVMSEPIEFSVLYDEIKKELYFQGLPEFNHIVNKELTTRIDLTKVSEDGTEVLEGAVFELYKVDDINGNVIMDTKTSDVSGKISFENLKVGKYLLKETQAPVGYILPEEMISFEIILNTELNKLEIIGLPEDLKIYNQEIVSSVKLVKVDSEDITKVLAGAKFSLMKRGTGSGEPDVEITQLVTGADGSIVFNDIKKGSYFIKEIQAPNGYEELVDVISFDVNELGEINWSLPGSSLIEIIEANNEVYLQVKNIKEPVEAGVLPQTGGNGNSVYTWIPLTLMVIGTSLSGFYWYQSRKGWKS